MRKQAIYQPSNKNTSLRQGEILTGVIQYNPVVSEVSQEAQELSFEQVIHPYAIVVTQDCDLDWDYRARQSDKVQPSKLLNSIILCEIAAAREVRDIADKSVMNSGEWNLVKSQRHERFYFFEKIPTECELEQIGLPELTADFKKVFGIDAAVLYRQLELGITKRRAVLSSPYLEHFSRRYHGFHGRVALPSQYESEREGNTPRL
jgi:hypothetical protein